MTNYDGDKIGITTSNCKLNIQTNATNSAPLNYKLNYGLYNILTVSTVPEAMSRI